MGTELRPVESDADYAAWRQVRIAVVPGERCDTAAELRRAATPERLLLLATSDGELAGSGVADLSQLGGGFVAPRVLPELRRRGTGSTLLRALASHLVQLGLADARATVDDAPSLAFAHRFGFTEIGRQVEQTRQIGPEPHPGRPPGGVQIVLASDRPGLWDDCYAGFGQQVLADFAVPSAMRVSRAEWTGSWAGDPMFLALHDGEVIGCAGLQRDTDKTGRAEHALTAVRRDWRHRGIAAYLKRLTLHWAAAHGISGVYTWTQQGNQQMRRLNELLGYGYGQESVSVSRPLPM
ncbi:MAG TPA: GNAT family N-acetyltransferase [Streptosporangiaceae bacterium]|jgi:N-acetylglutamate synthase-like GNAT family acetyltransferase